MIFSPVHKYIAGALFLTYNCRVRFTFKTLSASFFLLFAGLIAARAQTSYVYGEYNDLSYPGAYIGGSFPPSTNGITWNDFAPGIYGGGSSDLEDTFYFDPSTTNTFSSLTISDWYDTTSGTQNVTIYDGNGSGISTGFDAQGTQGSAPITLTGGTNQIQVAPREQLLIHNNIVVANVLSGGGSVGSQSWNLLDTLTTYGTVTAATGYTETLVIGGHNETLAAWNMLGSSSSPLLNITLNGVQVQIGNTETYDQLALVQNSEINISEIAANPGSPKVITFNGGFSPSSNQLLITGWQGQIGARATGGTGGENAELLFALGQGTVPAVAMNQLVTSVVFDLGDTDNLNAAVANAYGATSTSSTPLAIPNFAGQPGTHDHPGRPGAGRGGRVAGAPAADFPLCARRRRERATGGLSRGGSPLHARA
jgi:hypothetical protein